MTRTGPMDIGEVSRHTGLPASTLRYYEERGLIQSAGRHGLRRMFDSGVLEQLAFIALGRRAGFSLEEIASMFAADGRLEINRKQLLVKAEELEGHIKQLTAVRDGLRHAADCPAPNHLECPTFQRLVRLAGKSEVKSRRKPRRKARGQADSHDPLRSSR